ARAEDRRRAENRSGLVKDHRRELPARRPQAENTVTVRSVHVALRGVTRVFPATKQQAEVKALGAIDLDLLRGEFFAVVGPSGCGKSTLLEIIAGLNSPTDGSVTLEGNAIAG